MSRYRMGYAAVCFAALVCLAAAACSAPGSSLLVRAAGGSSSGPGRARSRSPWWTRRAGRPATSASSSTAGSSWPSTRPTRPAASTAGRSPCPCSTTRATRPSAPNSPARSPARATSPCSAPRRARSPWPWRPSCSPSTSRTSPPGQSTKLLAVGSPYLFLNGPTGLTYDSTLAKYLVQTKGYKKIAMLTNNDSYGAGEHDAFPSSLKSLGITPVADKVVPQDQTNMTPALTAIRGKNPQVLFIGAEEAQSGLTVKQARALGMNAVIAEGAPAGTPLYLSTAGRGQRQRHHRQLALPGQRRQRGGEEVRRRLHRGVRQRAGTARGQGLRRRPGDDRRAEGLPRLHRAGAGQRDPRGALRRAARVVRATTSRASGIFATSIGIIKNGKIEPVS